MLDLTQIVEHEDKGGGKNGAEDNTQGPSEDGVLSHFEEKLSQEEALDPLYEGIKDDDVGSLMPIAEHPAEHELTLVPDEADITLSYLNGGTDTEFMDQLLSEGDLGQKLSPGFLESEDPTAVRDGFIAQIKVLDAMLERVGSEEEQRGVLGGSQVDSRDASLNYEPAVESVNLKRHRRPNPKYFDAETEADVFFSAPCPPFRSCKEELQVSAVVSNGKAIFREEEGEEDGSAQDNDRPAHSEFFDCCSALPAGTHRARTVLVHKPRVFLTPTVLAKSSELLKSDSHLEKLSIRELHEAYRATFGKDTSVKDKHWLKRQIHMGSKKQKNVSGMGKENSRANDAPEAIVKVREDSSAEMPLSTFISNGHGMNGGNVGRMGTSTRIVINTPAVPLKRAHRKTLSLAVLSPSNPSTFSSTVEGRDAAGKSVNLDDAQERGMSGKRLRRPNRRYMDDEGDDRLGFGANVGPSVISKYLSASNGFRSRKSESESVADKYLCDTAKSTSCRGPARSIDHQGRRNDIDTNVTATSRKAERRAAKIIKLAHSHRFGRQDADGVVSVRKVKFKLPAAPGQEKGEVMNGGNGEQVSCVLPVLKDGSPDDYGGLSSHYFNRLEDNSEQPVITVPTANGGTRRKHHRPWTLEEVVTLVEGVAHCGGGKWAEIKKLYFSSLPYRTAVDLKDKWRNLLRASQAQLHPPKQGETRKKQFSASIPAYILARVRELAGLNGQVVGTMHSSSSRTNRNARIANKK